MKILVTGAAGFIGYHVAESLLARGHEVLGLDNLNDYYDVKLKESRLARLRGHQSFSFLRADVADRGAVEDCFRSFGPKRVVHLAAQAGVRYSLTNPHAYTESNVSGFLNVLEGCRHGKVEHLIYASSSSVYGLNSAMPLSEHQGVDHPISLYAATKRANELMAHSYAHLFGLPCTGLRFFTVYGPWGRPDMALFLFTKAILEGRPVEIFNQGEMVRDFTFIGDITEGVVRSLDRIPAPDPNWRAAQPDPATSSAPYRLYNIGNHRPVKLMDFITAIEKALGVEAQKKFLPRQAGDVLATNADVGDLMNDTGFHPSTPVDAGIRLFVDWYKDYYRG